MTAVDSLYPDPPAPGPRAVGELTEEQSAARLIAVGTGLMAAVSFPGFLGDISDPLRRVAVA